MTSRDEAHEKLPRFNCVLVRTADSKPQRYYAEMHPIEVGHWVRFEDVVALAAPLPQGDEPVSGIDWEWCEDCDHGIRGGAPCQSCGGTGRVKLADLLDATQKHVKELKATLRAAEKRQDDTPTPRCKGSWSIIRGNPPVFCDWRCECGLTDPRECPSASLPQGEVVEGFYEKLWKDFVSLQRGDAVGIMEKVERYYREMPQWEAGVLEDATEEMISAGEMAYLSIQYPDERNFASNREGRQLVATIYRAMLSARPAAKEKP